MSSSAPPLIALNGLLEGETRPGLRLDNRYAEAVLAKGGIPLAIPPVGSRTDLERLLERVDGLVLCGGDDFDTERLGLGPTHPAAQATPPAKQELDMALARAALARGTPVLGICYGMQLLGLIEGAGLHQHLPEDRPQAREHRHGVVHDVIVAPGSKLARVLGVERLPVVSRHHQALSAVAAPWCVAAVDDQGLIEAIERPDRTFAMGVQWHPELSPPDSPHGRLLEGLVDSAREAMGESASGAGLLRSRP